MRPAEIDLAGHKRVAVGGSKGRGSGALADEVSAAVVKSGRFEVVDRRNLGAIMKEQAFNLSDMVNENEAVQVGELTGASALLFFRVSDFGYGEKTFETTEKYKDSKGNEKTRQLHTRVGTARISATFEVVDTSSGKVLAQRAEKAQREARTSAYDQTPPPIPNSDALRNAVRSEVAKRFSRMIAPYQVTESVALAEDGDLPQLERGNKLARLGDWKGAINFYLKAVNKASDNKDLDDDERALAHYNLGLAYGLSGDYDKGLLQLKRAYELDDDDRIVQAMGRLKRYRTEDARLKKQVDGAE